MDIGFGRHSQLVFQVYLDDYTRRVWVDELADKAQSLKAWVSLMAKLQNEKHPLKVCAISRDNDPGYNSLPWTDFMTEHGIVHEKTGPYRKESAI